MKNYVVFNELTGEIITSGSCQAIDLELQAVHGKVLEGEGSNLTHYVNNNSLIPYTENQAVLKNTRQQPHMLWSNELLNWVDPRPVAEQEAAQWLTVRQDRNRRLDASDWTQLPDVPLPTKEAWAAYRQALRDVTDQPDPFEIVWPIAPG